MCHEGGNPMMLLQTVSSIWYLLSTTSKLVNRTWKRIIIWEKLNRKAHLVSIKFCKSHTANLETVSSYCSLRRFFCNRNSVDFSVAKEMLNEMYRWNFPVGCVQYLGSRNTIDGPPLLFLFLFAVHHHHFILYSSGHIFFNVIISLFFITAKIDSFAIFENGQHTIWGNYNVLC